MATRKEIAQFFQLALRLKLVATSTVERWADSIVAADPVVRFPITDLAHASSLPSHIVDDLLGQVTGTSDSQVAGRIAMAALRRCFHDGQVASNVVIRLAMEISFSVPLGEPERYQADVLDDALSGHFCTPEGLRKDVAHFLENYAAFDDLIPEGV